MGNADSNFRSAILALLMFGFVYGVSIESTSIGCYKGILDDKSEQNCIGGYAWKCNNTNLNKVPSIYPKYNESSKLCLLDLSWNNLTTIPNNSFVNLKDMLWLWLYQNNLTWIDSDAFTGLHNLLYLNLSSNLLENAKCFGKDVFKPLINLQNINLKNNSITSYKGLDDILRPIRSLRGLLISGCYNCTFGEGFKELTKLNSLSLSGSLNAGKALCNISTLFNETFTYLPYLSNLFMSFCHVTQVQTGSLMPLKNIQVLDISYNKKLHFKGMKDVLSSLVESDISTLDISAIHELFERGTVLRGKHIKPIKHLKNLTLLYMELNKLEIIEGDVFSMIPSSTSHISLAGNRLTYGKYVANLTRMTQVVYMDISRQHLNYDPFIQQHQERRSDSAKISLIHRGNKYTSQLTEQFYKNDEWKMMYASTIHTFETSNTYKHLHAGLKPTGDMISAKAFDNGSLSCLLCVASCTRNMTCVCAPENLRVLNWRASFVYVHIYGLRVCQPNSLLKLNLNFNLIEIWEGPVYGLENLEELNLSENVCVYMSSVFFDNFNGLLKLNVSYNFLGHVLDPNMPNAGSHFKTLKKLKMLDLSENRINALSKDVFKNLQELEYLNVSRNMLTKWDSELNSSCLKLVDLSNNKLETLSEQFRNYLDMLVDLPADKTCNSSDLTIDLAGNPIQCTCDSRPFLRWLSRTKVKILFYEHDECHLQDGKRLLLASDEVIPQFVEHLDTVCVPYGFIGVSIGIFLISIGLCIIIYRYRWKLRHIYYSKRRRHKHKGYDRLFERDAFVSYAKTEAGFIKEKLVPSLEGSDHGLKVWVADRDSIPGASIAENLTHAIYSSKKSILLLSRRYFTESWCNYEMNMARVESIESQRKLLIIVLYEDISAKEMPLDYLRLLKTAESIEYPRHPQHLDTFWESLARTIQEE